MLDRQLLRENPDLVRAGVARKHMDAPIDDLLAVDSEWRKLKTEGDTLRAELQKVSKEIGAMKARGEDASEVMARTRTLGDDIRDKEELVKGLESKLAEFELQIPNLAHASVPDGKTEDDNQQVRSWGEKPKFDFDPLPHWDLAEKTGILDFERGAKIAGSGFILYRGLGARLERSLINFMLDTHIGRHGYTELFVPFLANRDTMTTTGQLPKFEDDMYRLPEDDFFLIPTAEVPITNIFRDEILPAEKLTAKFCAYSPCFRREAGAAGRDTRGLLRVHQFNKVELVKFTKPEDSYDELETLCTDACAILEALGLHYRVSVLCTGEMSFSNAKCYDIEVWSPGVGKYLEVSSCSNFEAFQARRGQIRFRREQGAKPELVHTLNASGTACPRLFSAVVETYQQPDGSIAVPPALHSYLGTDIISIV